MKKLELLDFQKETLERTADQNKVAYYLDMGLGKTFIGGEKMNQLGGKMNLVVCQKSKIDDWIMHFNNYYPNFNTIDFKKLKSGRKTKADETIENQCVEGKINIVVVNYESIWLSSTFEQYFDTVMFDESSHLKNWSAKVTRFVCKKMRYENLILLSGTPCGGKYEELYTQIKLLGWNISKKDYWDRYIISHPLKLPLLTIEVVDGYKNVDDLKATLLNYGTIFMKTEEVHELPEKNFIDVYVENTKEYKTFDKLKLIDKYTEGFDELELDEEFVGDRTLTERIIKRRLCGKYNKNKLNKVKDIVDSCGDRIIIFYNFNEELDELKKTLKGRAFSFINSKGKDLKNYNNVEDSVTFVHYQAGAMGIDLQKSNKLLWYSPTEQNELFIQSIKRIHRIKQERACFYYKLIVEDSVEEEIYADLDEGIQDLDVLFEKSI